jgi:hypothetical protein
VVDPLEHDDFALVVGKGNVFSGAVGEREIRSGLADLDLRVGHGHDGE